MPLVDSGKIADLRRLLAERFPGRGMRGGSGVVRTGLGCVDVPLGGGLPRGEVVEIVAGGMSSGSGMLLAALLRRVALEQPGVGLVDGSDSFDPAGLSPEALQRILWARCREAKEAVRAADALVRDGNLPLVVMDLRGNRATELRGVPAHAWFRLQRVAAAQGVALLVATSRGMVGSARWRLRLDAGFALDALEREEGELLKALRVEVARGCGAPGG